MTDCSASIVMLPLDDVILRAGLSPAKRALAALVIAMLPPAVSPLTTVMSPDVPPRSRLVRVAVVPALPVPTMMSPSAVVAATGDTARAPKDNAPLAARMVLTSIAPLRVISPERMVALRPAVTEPSCTKLPLVTLTSWPAAPATRSPRP